MRITERKKRELAKKKTGIYKTSIEEMEITVKQIDFLAWGTGREEKNMYEVKSVRVYEKKDFEKLAEILKNIERPLDTEVSTARFMCEDIARGMCLDDGIVVKESNGKTVVTYEHNVV